MPLPLPNPGVGAALRPSRPLTWPSFTRPPRTRPPRILPSSPFLFHALALPEPALPAFAHPYPCPRLDRPGLGLSPPGGSELAVNFLEEAAFPAGSREGRLLETGLQARTLQVERGRVQGGRVAGGRNRGARRRAKNGRAGSGRAGSGRASAWGASARRASARRASARRASARRATRPGRMGRAHPLGVGERRRQAPGSDPPISMSSARSTSRASKPVKGAAVPGSSPNSISPPGRQTSAWIAVPSCTVTPGEWEHTKALLGE